MATQSRLEVSVSLSDKFYVGRDITSFEDNRLSPLVSRVTLLVDDETYYSAGDDSGMEISAFCPHATQEMADAILSSITGRAYHPYQAGAAALDPSAELGDGITVNGIYSVLSRFDDDGSGYPDISAPGDNELEDEYPIQGPLTKELNRKLAATRSLITKTADEIRLEVQGLDNKYTALSVTLDGVTITDDTGTTLIKGSSIETGTLYVDAAHVSGTLSANQINMTGAITWDDLSEGVQSSISSSGMSSSEVKTLITSTLVSSPTIAGGTFTNLYQDTWIKIGADDGYEGLVLTNDHYGDGGAFGVFIAGSSGSIILRGPNSYNFLLVDSNQKYAVPTGEWNFANATVTGLVATFG